MDNSAQREYWNTTAGEKWAREADVLDAMLAPFSRAVLDAAALRPGERVLDVGCGAGSLSLLAAVETPSLHVIGVDISEPLTDLARARAGSARLKAGFNVADASEWRGVEPFDALISRFGVMFFADAEAAFAHLRSLLRPEGRMAFACWRPLAENPWALAPLQIAAPFLKEPLPQADPYAPGPFAFADTAYLERILATSGWKNVSIKPMKIDILLPGSRVEDTVQFMLEIGPLARIIKEQAAEPGAIKAALGDFVRLRVNAESRLALGASVSIVSGHA